MNPTVIFDAVVGFLRSVNAVLSVVPALVWAVALALAASYGSFMHHERDSAVSERNVVQAMYEQLTVKVIRQKLEATELYKRLLAERDALQTRINEARKAQEKKDANNQKLIDDQAARLRALTAASPGGQLRDPNGAGRGCSGPDAKSDAAAPAGNRADNGAAPGGLLSAPLSGLLLELTREADHFNAAYESARGDALMCRAAMGASP